MVQVEFVPSGWMTDDIGENSHVYLHLCKSGKKMEITLGRPPVTWCEACGFGGLWVKIPEGTDGVKLESKMGNKDTTLRQRIDKKYQEWLAEKEDFEVVQSEIEEILIEEIQAEEMYYED